MFGEKNCVLIFFFKAYCSKVQKGFNKIRVAQHVTCFDKVDPV